jgi:hypothetical protein
MGFLINNKLIKKNTIFITAIFAIFLLAAIVWAAGTPPQWIAGSLLKNQTTVYSNMFVNFTSNWTDSETLRNWTFQINQSGSWVNSSVIAFGTDPTSNRTSNVTFISAIPGTTVSWRFWAYDNETNLNVTSTQTFLIADNQPPLWTAGTLLAEGQQYQSGIMTLRSNWTDNTTLDSFILELNQSGSGYTNSTPVAFTSNGMTNNTVLIGVAEGNIVSWRFWVNDTSNNLNVTDLQTFMVEHHDPIAQGGSPSSGGGSPSASVVNYTNYTYRCTDTDYAGTYPTINYNLKGTATVIRNDGKVMYTGTDICINGTTNTTDLTEYSCAASTSSGLGQYSTKCQYGCSNGACLQQVAPATSCAEDPSLPGCSTDETPILRQTPIRISRSPGNSIFLGIVGSLIVIVIIGMMYSAITLKKKK